MVPHEADHVTDVVAENCRVPPSVTVGLVGWMEKLVPFPAPERGTVCGLLLAESVKTSAWRYMMRAEPFNRDDDADRDHFRQSLTEIFQSNKSI